MRHETDVTPREDAWVGVETKVRRSHARRMAFASGMTVVVLIAAGLAVPRLLTPAEDPGGFATTGPTTPASPAPSATAPPGIVTDDWTPRVGVQLGFSAKIPQDWRGGWFEGHWDFHPKSLPGLTEGGDTFSVEIHAAKFANGPWADQERKLSAGEQVTINGQPFERRETTDAGPKIAFYAGNWTYPADEYLLIQVYGSTDALWNKYREIGEAIANTVTVYDGSKPVHGTIASGIAVDGHTKALVKFLDARVEGVGAEDLMTAQASEQYNGDQLGLYGQGQPPVYWKRWELQRRDEADASSVQFVVDMVRTEDMPAVGGGEGHRGSGQIEEIGVGPGKSVNGQSMPSLIRYGQQLETYSG